MNADMSVSARRVLAAGETEPIDCVETYGSKFTACKRDEDGSWDCCLVGDNFDFEESTPSSNEENKDPIDCFKTYGSKFNDCERAWGWDCCMVEDILGNNEKNSTESVLAKNTEPIDCTKKLGLKFQDCETELGWDCCFVGDEMAEGESNWGIKFEGPSTCSQELGPEFTDCGHGYGLDCCYIDDGVFKHDHEHANDSSELKDSGALKHFDAFYQTDERKGCVAQLGTNWTECGTGFGLDCCYIDDGVLFYDHGHVHSGPDVHVLRWFVIVAVIAFFVINNMQRKSSKSSRSSKRVGKKSVPDYDDAVDDNGDEVELRPLI